MFSLGLPTPGCSTCADPHDGGMQVFKSCEDVTTMDVSTLGQQHSGRRRMGKWALAFGSNWDYLLSWTCSTRVADDRSPWLILFVFLKRGSEGAGRRPACASQGTACAPPRDVELSLGRYGQVRPGSAKI